MWLNFKRLSSFVFLEENYFPKNDFEFLVFSIFSYLIGIITEYNKLFLKGT